MGTEAYANTILGVAVYRDDLQAITVSVPASSHPEDRWDPRTGKKVDPVIVKDESYEYCKIDGKHYLLDNEFAGELADKLMELAGAPTAAVVVVDGFEAVLIGRVISSTDCYGCGSAFDGPGFVEQSQYDELAKWKEKLESLLGVTLSSGLFTFVQVGD